MNNYIPGLDDLDPEIHDHADDACVTIADRKPSAGAIVACVATQFMVSHTVAEGWLHELFGA